MRVGMAGLGTVGGAVARLLDAQEDLLAARGAKLQLIAVSARERGKKRDYDVSETEWLDDPLALAARADVDIVVEVMGGADGAAYDLAKAALAGGKHLVTANKAMIAKHGAELKRLADEFGVCLAYEAAVCGGVPVVKLLREGLAGNRIVSLRGIVNGTCNYILTRMHEQGISFDEALGEAQGLGYAEAAPAADIDGQDAACKLAILSALAFGTPIDLAAVKVTGIRDITLVDLNDAKAKGGKIKLIGSATLSAAALSPLGIVPPGVMMEVGPVFVSDAEPLAHIGGVTNAVEVTGDFCGEIMIQGAGAGGKATASAVVADLVDIARGQCLTI